MPSETLSISEGNIDPTTTKSINYSFRNYFTYKRIHFNRHGVAETLYQDGHVGGLSQAKARATRAFNGSLTDYSIFQAGYKNL